MPQVAATVPPTTAAIGPARHSHHNRHRTSAPQPDVASQLSAHASKQPALSSATAPQPAVLLNIPAPRAANAISVPNSDDHGSTRDAHLGVPQSRKRSAPAKLPADAPEEVTTAQGPPQGAVASAPALIATSPSEGLLPTLAHTESPRPIGASHAKAPDTVESSVSSNNGGPPEHKSESAKSPFGETHAEVATTRAPGASHSQASASSIASHVRILLPCFLESSRRVAVYKCTSTSRSWQPGVSKQSGRCTYPPHIVNVMIGRSRDFKQIPGTLYRRLWSHHTGARNPCRQRLLNVPCQRLPIPSPQGP